MIAPPPFEEDEEETPLQQLIRHWMDKQHVPDVLPISEDVLSGLLDHIQSQVGEMIYILLSSSIVVCDMGPLQSKTVQLLRSYPSSSKEEHFRIMLAQTEWVKFVVRSYLRTRLFKASKVCYHATSVQPTTTTSDRTVCSIYHDRSRGSTMSLGEPSRPRLQVTIFLPLA